MSLWKPVWKAQLGAALVLSAALPIAAQTEAAAAGGDEPALSWFDQFIVKGGTITFVIIGLSVVSLALMVEHCISIRRATIVAPEAAGRIRGLIEERNYVEAVKFTASEPSMLSYVVYSGLLEAGNGFPAMERAVEESLEDRASRLFRKIEYLNIIGAVAPMLGLFGTVYGMILLFASIREMGSIPAPGLIADSLSIALLTTFWGLIVAIPSLAAFGLFRNRIDMLTAECALTAERLLSVFKPGAAGAVGGAGATGRGGAVGRAGSAAASAPATTAAAAAGAAG